MSSQQFRQIVSLFLDHWHVLTFAKEYMTVGYHTMGRIEALPGKIMEYFSKKHHNDINGLADFLSEYTNYELDIILEDGSAESIAKELVDGYSSCLEGNGDMFLQEARESLSRLTKPSISGQTDVPLIDSTDEDDENQLEDE